MSDELKAVLREAVMALVENDLSPAEVMTALAMVNASVIYSIFPRGQSDTRTVDILMGQVNGILADGRFEIDKARLSS